MSAPTFSNKKRLSKKLNAIPKEVRRALRAQNGSNAVELVQTMKGFAPGDDALTRSIKSRDVSDSRRISERVQAGGPETTRPVREGQSATYDYALAQEYSTEKMPAHPFFWPAWRLKRRRFKARMSRAGKKAALGAIK
jgi:hypothetical protein